jgi:hypothetical protein
MESEVQILLQDEYNHVKNIHDCREQKQSNNKKNSTHSSKILE